MAGDKCRYHDSALQWSPGVRIFERSMEKMRGGRQRSLAKRRVWNSGRSSESILRMLEQISKLPVTCCRWKRPVQWGWIPEILLAFAHTLDRSAFSILPTFRRPLSLGGNRLHAPIDGTPFQVDSGRLNKVDSGGWP